MKIIGFTGKKQSGKTTASDYIVKNYNDFVKIGFKDPLVSELKNNFPMLLRYFSDNYNIEVDELFLEKPNGIRILMQEYGSDVRRKDDYYYWVKKFTKVAKRMLDDSVSIVVDDVRFLNEAEAIKNLGGIIIRINDGSEKEKDSHISEVEMNRIIADEEVDNYGSIDDFYNSIRKIKCLN